MLLLTLLVCLSPSVLAKLGEFEDDIDLADFDLDIVRHLKDGVFVHSVFLISFTQGFIVHTGATQGPPAGENHTNKGKVRLIELYDYLSLMFNCGFQWIDLRIRYLPSIKIKS